MDRYVIGYIHPFVLGQQIAIYENEKEIASFDCTLDQMEEMIYNLCVTYNVNKVIFKGGQLYALKFKDNFIAHKFGNKNIEVQIIG